MYILLALLLNAPVRADVGREQFDFDLATLVAEARTAEGLRRVCVRLGDPFFGLTPEQFVRVVMSGDFTVGDRPLRAGEAFRLLIGGAFVLAEGEVTAHQMEIFGRLASYARDFADVLTLARAPGREPFVRARVSDALVSAQWSRFRTWNLTPHDWATILSFWSPAVVDPQECARIVATFGNARDLRIALSGVTRPDLRRALERAAPQRCRTYLWRGAVAIRFP